MRNINNKYFAIPVAVVAILFSACSSEDIVEEKGTSSVVSGQKNVLTADLTDVNVTRTTLDGLVVNWADDDHIGVFVEAQGCSYPLASNDYKIKENNQTYASFESASDVKTDEDGTYYAVYPYNSNVNLSSDKKVSFTIPTSSPEVGYHSKFHFMTAKAAEGSKTLSFKAAVAYLKLEIKHSDSYDNFKPTKITLTAVGGEKLNGTYSVTIGENGTPSIITDNIGVGGSDVITIGAVDANEDNEEDVVKTGVYYIPVIPQTYSQGIAIKMEDNRAGNKKEFDRVSNTNLQIAFNDIVNLGTYSTKKIGKEAYVDLGLTSGTKWCIENVYDEAGATIAVPTNVTARTTRETSPSSSFYAWGELYVKDNQYKDQSNDKNNSNIKNEGVATYSWYANYSLGQDATNDIDNATRLAQRSYRFGVGRGTIASNRQNRFGWEEAANVTGLGRFSYPTSGLLYKYNKQSAYTSSYVDWVGSSTDNYTELQTEDDAAYQKSPLNRVQIPTSAQFTELITAVSNKTLTLTKVDNVYKIENTKTHRYITLPIAGYMHTVSATDVSPNKLNSTTPTACYWSRTLTTTNNKSYYKAHSLEISGNDMKINQDAERCQGRMLRGVVK